MNAEDFIAKLRDPSFNPKEEELREREEEREAERKMRAAERIDKECELEDWREELREFREREKCKNRAAKEKLRKQNNADLKEAWNRHIKKHRKKKVGRK